MKIMNYHLGIQNGKSRNYQGSTLIELVVAIAIGIIIMILVANLMTRGFLSQLVGFSSFNAQADATATLNRVAKEIRQGPGIQVANSQDITILEYINVTDTAPYKIRFYLSGQNLIRGSIAPTGVGPNYTYDNATETFKTIATSVTNGASTIFQYYDQNGTLLSSPIAVGNITLIKATLTFGDTKLHTAFTATTQIQLRFKKTNL